MASLNSSHISPLVAAPQFMISAAKAWRSSSGVAALESWVSLLKASRSMPTTLSVQLSCVRCAAGRASSGSQNLNGSTSLSAMACSCVTHHRLRSVSKTAPKPMATFFSLKGTRMYIFRFGSSGAFAIFRFSMASFSSYDRGLPVTGSPSPSWPRRAMVSAMVSPPPASCVSAMAFMTS